MELQFFIYFPMRSGSHQKAKTRQPSFEHGNRSPRYSTKG
jgi:hypothetical protein